MKNPIRTLQDEHQLLIYAITLGTDIQKVKNDERYRILIRDFILFIRNFTEIYHFPKEETIFYPMLRNRSKNMGEDFMHEIYDNHEDFKALVAEIENYYAAYDYFNLRQSIGKYLNEMFDHLNRENRIILNNASALFNESELNSIYKEFCLLDEKFGEKEKLTHDFSALSHETELTLKAEI
ncbi:MAG: hemerythrin domain-containing protein [Bacteroidia bacterium]|nr:hemerythrin domain-containing protein [Bacteroidia bacterium]